MYNVNVYSEKYVEDELIGRFLLLSDGLGTWVLSSLHSHIEDLDFCKKFIKIDAYAKKYFVSNINKEIDRNIISAFCIFYESVWKEIIEDMIDLDIYQEVNLNLYFDIKERIYLFKSYGVRNHGYLLR